MLDKVKNNDPQDMLGKVEAFKSQLQEGKELSSKMTVSDKLSNRTFTNIALCGMGGSAISGDVMAAYFREELDIPFQVVRDYSLPAWVGRDTLLFAASYSGNTEETISCLEQALDRGSGAYGISSGGKVIAKCRGADIDHMVIPSGWPPRSALGFLITPIAKVLHLLGLVSTSMEDMVDSALERAACLGIEFLEQAHVEPNILAQLVNELKDGLLMIYAPPELEVVARRWMTQINENSKTLTHWGGIPEMNHNELVGWSGTPLRNKYTTIFLSHDNINRRTAERIRLTVEVLKSRGLFAEVLELPGADHKEALISGIYMGDIFSLYLAGYYDQDPSPVKVIDTLKGELAKM